MQRSGYSLYDRYQLSNSSAIPTFNGSNGDAAIKVSQYMQGLYDQNMGTAMQTNAGVDNMQGHPADQDVVNQTKEYYKGKLHELSKSGDWENMLPQTQQLASQYARDAQAISSIQMQKQEWAKQLDDKDNKLTGYQKQGLLSIAEDEYRNSPGKLKRDGAGRLTGQYSGTRVDRNIDVAEKVDNWMKSAAAQEGGRIKEGTDGTWMYKNGDKWEIMSSARIQKIVNRAAANDQEFQGYTDMMGRITSNGLDKINDPNQLKEGPYKQQALKLAKEQGISFGSALKKVVYQNTAQGVLGNALSYGTTKYTKNNQWTEDGITGADPYHLKKTKEGPDNTPTIIQGPNTKTTNDEQDLGKITTTAQNLTKDVTDIDGQIGRFTKALQNNALKPEERTQLQSNLNNAILRKTNVQSQIDRVNTIVNYSKMRTAQDMGYNSYDDLIKTQTGKILPDIKKLWPNGIKTNSGKEVSQEEIAKAVLEGRVQANWGTSGTVFGGSSFGGGSMGANDRLQGVTITLSGGHKVKVPDLKRASAIQKLTQDAVINGTTKMNEFNKLQALNYTKNVKDHSIEDNIMTLDDERTKDFTNALRGAYDGVKFKKIGEYGEVSESDRPANFRVNALGMPGPNGESRLMVEELDEKDKPTGNRFEANASNSNINEKMARYFGKQPSPESRQAAAMLHTGSPSTMLKGQPLGARIEIGEAVFEGKPVKAHITISGTDDKPEYNLTDEHGKIIHTTKLIGTAGQWINTIKGTK